MENEHLGEKLRGQREEVFVRSVHKSATGFMHDEIGRREPIDERGIIRCIGAVAQSAARRAYDDGDGWNIVNGFAARDVEGPVTKRLALFQGKDLHEFVACALDR